MVVGILLVYFPPALLEGGHVLHGSDHRTLHARRLAYAREHLFSSDPRLPGWYTRELLGTPFWSNVQNFPFTPPRLVLLAFEPHAAYAVGVNLAAVLTGLFTYLYCRRIGLAALPAAAAGWTFACCGYFASRVMVGHLPLLEAFPALPLLLWLIEVCLAGRSDDSRAGSGAPELGQRPRPRHLLALGLAAGCVAVAGHPQLPVYALAAAFLYALWRGARRWQVPAALALGVGAGSFALLPMLALVSRSTRVLALDPPNNNIPMPYGRLAGFVFPWQDGWPSAVQREPARAFGGYPDPAWFWDTVCYVGILPLLAAVALAAWALVRRRTLPARSRPWPFIAALGVLSLLMALPAVHQLSARLPGTFLRSPSRLLYLTSFALALGLGAALDVLVRYGMAHLSSRRRPWALAALATIAVALAAHAADLASHARSFVVAVRLPREFAGAAQGTEPGNGPRSAIGMGLWMPINRRIDDVGFFDSIMLARPYRSVLALDGKPPGFNTQVFNGTQMNAAALALLGVELVLTSSERPDLAPLGGRSNGVQAYQVRDASQRCAFFGLGAVRVLDRDAIQERFRRVARDPSAAAELRSTMALPPDAPGASALPAAGASPPIAPAPSAVVYRRVSSDVIDVDVSATEPGYVRVLEAWDEGWGATVDGQPADVEPGDDTFLAVRVPPGTHQVVLEYRTKYAAAGAALSLPSAALLGLLARTVRRPRNAPAA